MISGKNTSRFLDSGMCALMNVLQWQRRDEHCTRDDFERYLDSCAALSREEFYAFPDLAPVALRGSWLEWPTPRPSGFPENDHVRVRYFPSPSGPHAPTLILLHALMSGSDVGYRRLAATFNSRGWAVAFPHLPYHYSRTPRGYANGLLAINANLIRVAETLRQCVTELRQLLAHLRRQGASEFALLGTSYGGWNASLLSFLEPDLRFVALIQPIVNLEHAIWHNPGSATLRSLLRRQDIPPGATDSHSHLCSPLHGVPLCGGHRTFITAGLYDRVAPLSELEKLPALWPGARLTVVNQGHFGYSALKATLSQIDHLL